jgi:hypothetical protein
MKTLTWQRSAKLDGVTWDLQLIDGRLNMWRDSVAITTAYGGKSIVWQEVAWPEKIVAAWQEMLDVMRREAGR